MNIENPNKKKTPLKSMNMIFTIVFLTILFVQVRIIYYKSKSNQVEPVVIVNLDKGDRESRNSRSSGINNISDNGSCINVGETITYTKGTLLLVVILISLSGVFFLKRLLRIENHSLERLIQCVVQTLIIQILIPIILIVRNQSMMNHGKAMINSKLPFILRAISEPTKLAQQKEIEDKNSENTNHESSHRLDPAEPAMFPKSKIPQVVISNDFTTIEC